MLKIFSKYLTAYIIIFFFIRIATFANVSNATQETFPRTYLNFTFYESNLAEQQYIIDNHQTIPFEKYQGEIMPFNKPIHNRLITLKASFTIDRVFCNENIYLVFLPIDYHCKVYFNGELIAVKGNRTKLYTNRIHYSDKILLSSGSINYNGDNHIIIQLFPMEGEKYPINKMFISNAKDAGKYVFLRNVVGPKLIFGLSLCGFVFFLFFLTVYITRREYKKQHFLFFALMNLFFVLSYINNIFTNDFSNTFIYEKIARVSFPLSVYVAICFLIEYTNLFEQKRKIKWLLLIIYIPAVIMILIPDTTTEVIGVYNTFPLISLILGTFILFAISLAFYIKERSITALFLLIIFFLNIIAGMHDGYYFAFLKTKPFVLLTPNTVFGINLIIFFILAVDHSKLYHLALNSSEKLERMNQDLERLVEQRTEKTREYAHKLEEANNTKDKFFSIIAHDLKNPFNTLIGYSEILKNEFRDYREEEIHEQLQIIHDTSVKGYNLLENLLKWSQTQTDKLEFKPTKVELYEMVQMCIDDVDYQCQFKDIEIHNEIPEELYLTADKNLLRTILRNLINNAVKFTERNGYIIISSNQLENMLEISVKDSGVGMTKSEVESLFKIDKVLSKPGTEKEMGSGLGLILCKEFIEKHGGDISVISTIDVGSEFKITLPNNIQPSIE